MSWWVVPEGNVGEVLGGIVSVVTGKGTKIPLMHVIQAASKPPGSPVYGPYPTQAKAQTQANTINTEAGKASQAGAAADPGAPPGANSVAPSGWQLVASGFSGWFVRGLKVVFGGVLMILAISHLTGVSNAVTKALPVAAAVA